MPRDTYIQLLKETKEFYKKLKKTHSKHVDGELITFGNSGFTHLLIKDRKTRPIDEQFRKLSLVKYIPSILNSETVQKEVRVIPSKEYGHIEYLAITCELDKKLVKMILRKLGKGNYHFWSIMDQ